jgi:hypothetical protein
MTLSHLITGLPLKNGANLFSPTPFFKKEMGDDEIIL